MEKKSKYQLMIEKRDDLREFIRIRMIHGDVSEFAKMCGCTRATIRETLKYQGDRNEQRMGHYNDGTKYWMTTHVCTGKDTPKRLQMMYETIVKRGDGWGC
jgi:hypothetical protein